MRGVARNGGSQPPVTDPPADFSGVDTWVFDLDNTLYPSECNLFAEVDQRMGDFIARYLGVPVPYARHLQKSYYRQFGTTLFGLMHVHKMDPKPFLDYVHDIDLSVVPEAPELRSALMALPGRKLIFTNGSVRHAERVAGKIGILDLFDGICDIVACDYAPKPTSEAFSRMVVRHAVNATRSAMFEDMPQNLEVPHALGMQTVLIKSTYIDHPAQAKVHQWATPPAHVHYVTDDLCRFLVDIRSHSQSSDASIT